MSLIGDSEKSKGKWFEENEVIGKPISYSIDNRKENWSSELDEKLLLSEGVCKNIKLPVKKGEKPVAFRCNFSGKYYGLYDRTGCIKVFNSNELEDFQMTQFHIRDKLTERPIDKRFVGITCGGLSDCDIWLKIYDVSETREYKAYKLKKLLQ